MISNKPLPPFGKALHTLLQQGYKPRNSIYLFLGKSAWEAVKRVVKTQHALVLPPERSPFNYQWPVQHCDVLAFDTSNTPYEQIEKVGYALLIAGALTVRIVLKQQMVIYRRQ